MKLFNLQTAVISGLLLFSLNSLAVKGYVKGKYEVDPAHSRISFVIPHFVVSEVEGRFNEVKGEFELAEPFAGSTFTATVPVQSIDTGVKQRDEHLRSKDFFEVSKYPNMKIVSKSITGNDDAFKVIASVTIKDVTKDVTFEGKCTGFVVDTWGKQRAAFQLTGTINRKDFHINYNEKVAAGAAVGDEVKIRVWSEGILAAAKGK